MNQVCVNYDVLIQRDAAYILRQGSPPPPHRIAKTVPVQNCLYPLTLSMQIAPTKALFTQFGPARKPIPRQIRNLRRNPRTSHTLPPTQTPQPPTRPMLLTASDANATQSDTITSTLKPVATVQNTHHPPVLTAAPPTNAKDMDAINWHITMDHTNLSTLQKMAQRHLVTGLPDSLSQNHLP